MMHLFARVVRLPRGEESRPVYGMGPPVGVQLRGIQSGSDLEPMSCCYG